MDGKVSKKQKPNYWSLRKEKKELEQRLKTLEDKTSDEYKSTLDRIGQITDIVGKQFPKWVDPAVKVGTCLAGLIVCAWLDGGGNLTKHTFSWIGKTRT